jgi:hypothetical protein
VNAAGLPSVLMFAGGAASAAGGLLRWYEGRGARRAPADPATTATAIATATGTASGTAGDRAITILLDAGLIAPCRRPDGSPGYRAVRDADPAAAAVPSIQS